MPATPRTILAPLPNDPRVMALAKAVGIQRREAFAIAAEAWAWMAAVEVDGLVPKTPPSSLDTLVDVEGFGAAMLQAGLVGVVDDSLVLPAELRRDERDQSEPRRRPAGEDDQEKEVRRKECNREAAARYRRKAKLTRQSPPPGGKPTFRSLGRAAGHEVRAFEGPHGVYALLLDATLDGRPCKKLTAGDKAWSLESVRLVDVLPGLLEKADKLTHGGLGDPPRLVPAVADLEEAAARERAKASLLEGQAADQCPRHADASSRHHRHADASSSVIIPSSSADAPDGTNSNAGNDLPRHHASSSANDDAVSSMSCLSKSSSSFEEEDVRRGGREAGRGDDDADEPEALREWEAKREQARGVAARIGEALGLEVASVIRLAKHSPEYLLLRCREHGVDPRTGLKIDAGAAAEPPGARGGIDTTVEPPEQAKPATGSPEASGAGAPDQRDHNSLSKVERLRASCGTLRAAAALGAGRPTLKLIEADANADEIVSPVALG